MCTMCHEGHAPARHNTSQPPPGFQQHEGEIKPSRETPLPAGLRSRSHSMLKREGLRSHPGVGCSSWGEGWRHEGSLCHYLTRRERVPGPCPWPPVLTAGAHKCKRVPLFPPPTPRDQWHRSSHQRGDWGRAAVPTEISPFLGDNTSLLWPATAAIAGQTPKFA